MPAHAFINYTEHGDFLHNSYASLIPVQHFRESGEKILHRAVDFLKFRLACAQPWQLKDFRVCPSFRDPGTEVMTNFEILYMIFVLQSSLENLCNMLWLWSIAGLCWQPAGVGFSCPVEMQAPALGKKWHKGFVQVQSRQCV